MSIRTLSILSYAIIAFIHPLLGQQKATAVSATLQRLEREYMSTAAVTDSAIGRRLVEPSAVIVNPDGSVYTGEQMLRSGWTGEVVLDSVSADSLQVRQLAPTVALVYGRAHLRGRFKAKTGMQDITGDYRVIDVWRQRNGHWRIAGEQSSKIETH